MSASTGALARLVEQRTEDAAGVRAFYRFMDDNGEDAVRLLTDMAAKARVLLDDDDMPNHWSDCVCSYCRADRDLREALARFAALEERAAQ